MPAPKAPGHVVDWVIGSGTVSIYRQGGNYLIQHKERMGETEIRTMAVIDEITDLKGLAQAFRMLSDKREQKLDEMRPPKKEDTIQVSYYSGIARPSDYTRGIGSWQAMRETPVPKCGMEVCEDCDCEKAGWFQKTWRNLKRDLRIGA